MIAFILTMPNKGSWNGRWSGERDLYAIVKCERNVPNKDIIGKSFFTDGMMDGLLVYLLKRLIAKRVIRY